MNQLYIHAFLREPPSHQPIPPLQVVTEPCAELPGLYGGLPRVCMSVHPTLSFPCYPQVRSLPLPCKEVYHYHFSRFHILVEIFIKRFSIQSLIAMKPEVIQDIETGEGALIRVLCFPAVYRSLFTFFSSAPSLLIDSDRLLHT